MSEINDNYDFDNTTLEDLTKVVLTVEEDEQLELPLSLIKHEEDGQLIYQRFSDGYVNATAMCKVAGKEWSNYSQLESTKAFLKELSKVEKCDIKASPKITRTALVYSIQGGRSELQGTWVHPQVAINLGQWLSPKFAVRVSKWILDWMNGKTPKSSLPYHLRRYMNNANSIPNSHFSILQELYITLIAPLEAQGYVLPENLVPDISEGKIFANWLRSQGINTNKMLTYQHKYEDGRVVNAKLYPAEFLNAFRQHFSRVWLPKRAVKYFQTRDVAILPYLNKILQLNAEMNKMLK